MYTNAGSMVTSCEDSLMEFISLCNRHCDLEYYIFLQQDICLEYSWFHIDVFCDWCSSMVGT